MTPWTIHGREFTTCNCAYGCPCQFNALPTHGDCKAVVAIQIDRGHHGSTKLDGLRMAGIFRWPKAIHEGNGEVVPIVDVRANKEQREAILRIMTGQDTKPGATIFNVFSTTYSKAYDPVFTAIDFEVDVSKRHSRLKIDNLVETRGEPIVNPVTKEVYRGRIDLPNGFEYSVAEIGRGWTKTKGPIAFDLADTHGHFAELHLCQDGLVK